MDRMRLPASAQPIERRLPDPVPTAVCKGQQVVCARRRGDNGSRWEKQEQLRHSHGRWCIAAFSSRQVHAGVRDSEPMIALQIPDNADWPEVIFAAQMQDFLRDCLWRPVRMVVRNRSLVGQPRLAVICKGMTPSIEAGSPDPEVSAGLADVTRRRSVIQNAQLAPDFLLVFSHRTHHPTPKWRLLKVSR